MSVRVDLYVSFLLAQILDAADNCFLQSHVMSDEPVFLRDLGYQTLPSRISYTRQHPERIQEIGAK